ncbi:Probable protein phosphatase 2C 26 (AtPP2C26) [Durusdinium trenchii]|uniref:Protein phosphatase n=1 Tax=Durusdinium trenchii TaxID=1381693 RepID=A0ABP0RH19_9DINO
MADGMLRSPTFLVGAERQRKNLDEFKRREQQLAEAYHKNKPLCFNGCSYQRTHPVKAQKGHKDADACLTVPLVLGVADGVSQIEDFGIDASMLPNELLQVVEQLGMHQLIPGAKLSAADTYRGPVSMLRRAFEATESLGSLTVVLAVMDNSTRIHGKLHPMIAIITVGDCELVVLRRVKGPRGPLELVCHTEMQRIDGHAQTPLQLARVDDRIDPNFNEELTIEVIERGSAVNCVSAYEGDIVIMGSDGVFDNLFLDEILDLANTMLPPGQAASGYPETALKSLAQRIVEQCHAKTRPLPNGVLAEAPIGRGGKKDDTSCVVAEVVEWTQDLQQLWTPPPQPTTWLSPFTSLSSWLDINTCCGVSHDSDDEDFRKPSKRKAPFPDATMSAACGSNSQNVPQNGWNEANQPCQGFQDFQAQQQYPNQQYQAQQLQANQQYQANQQCPANQQYQGYQPNQSYPGYGTNQQYMANQPYHGYQANQAQANQCQASQSYQSYQGNQYPTSQGYQYQANQAYQGGQGFQGNGYQGYPQAQAQMPYQMGQTPCPASQNSLMASQMYAAPGGFGGFGSLNNGTYGGCAGRY